MSYIVMKEINISWEQEMTELMLKYWLFTAFEP